MHREHITPIVKLNLKLKCVSQVYVKGTINCAPFADFVIQISSSQVDDAKDLNKMMLIYNLIEYNDNYSKTSRSF